MECAIRTIRKINFNMGAIKVEDTKRIRFSNMAKFMFNEDQAIIFNRLNGQWIKVPKQCYDILELCNKEGLSWSALSESLADDEDREYMKQLIKLLDSMNCLYNDDEKIIELFFERSEQGIRELDIKYGKDFHNLSYHIVGSRQGAEECVNDAYLGAWNAIPPARPNPLLTYICKIVRNISLKVYYRKEAAKRSSHYTIAMEEIEACIAAPNTVEAEIEARELARIIEEFLNTLTVENRVIFMRRYWFSDSYKDIAEFVGLSEKNISVRLTRIREKMKQYLIEREVFV